MASVFSDQRLGELLDIRYPHQLVAARKELVARDLIAYEGGLYQVLDLPARAPSQGPFPSPSPPQCTPRSSFFSKPKSKNPTAGCGFRLGEPAPGAGPLGPGTEG